MGLKSLLLLVCVACASAFQAASVPLSSRAVSAASPSIQVKRTRLIALQGVAQEGGCWHSSCWVSGLAITALSPFCQLSDQRCHPRTAPLALLHSPVTVASACTTSKSTEHPRSAAALASARPASARSSAFVTAPAAPTPCIRALPCTPQSLVASAPDSPVGGSRRPRGPPLGGTGVRVRPYVCDHTAAQTYELPWVPPAAVVTASRPQPLRTRAPSTTAHATTAASSAAFSLCSSVTPSPAYVPPRAPSPLPPSSHSRRSLPSPPDEPNLRHLGQAGQQRQPRHLLQQAQRLLAVPQRADQKVLLGGARPLRQAQGAHCARAAVT